MTISHSGGLEDGLFVEAMQVLVESRAALTTEGGLENVKISRSIGINKGIGKEIETLGTKGIDAKAIVEVGVSCKEIVYGTGRHGLEVIIFFGQGIGTGGGLRDTRRRGSSR